MEPLVGHLFQRSGSTNSPGHGRFRFQRFFLPLNARAEFVERYSFVLASAYTAPGMRRDSCNRPDLPTAANIRKGDLGEALAATIYDQVLAGFEVPASKLWLKPNPDTSQHGEDNVAVSVRSGTKPRPVTIESKVRTGKPGPQALLKPFEDQLCDRSSTRRAAWIRAADALNSLPKYQIEFAYLLADLMARESRSDLPQPTYEMHGFLVCEPGALSEEAVASRWGNRAELSISRLVIVEIDQIDELVAEILGRTSEHTVADLSPHPDILAVESADVVPGLSSPLAIDLRHPPPMDCAISRSALWYLADRDGLGAATALDARSDKDPIIRALGALLTGSAPDKDDVALCDLDSLVEAVTQAWQMPRDSEATDKETILAVARSITAEAGRSTRLRLVAEAVAYRLDRHPHRLVPPHLRSGPVVSSVIEQLVSRGIVGLWPAQAEVLGSGLLQDPVESFIVQLATSAGKTLLIALTCAVALDQRPDRQVVVVASTRALVRQLRRELRLRMPAVEIVPVLGEIEFAGENCFPESTAPGRVVVTTPERLELDWRRATTESTPIDAHQQVSLIVVDEAHLLSEPTRGTRLEAVVAKTLRYSIPIQLFSSQLGDLDQLSQWLEAEHVASDWQPAHVERSAFYRSEDGSQGFLMPTNREPETCMTMPSGKWDRSNPSLARSGRVSSMAAGLALSRYKDGTVLLYTAQKRYARSVADAVAERADDGWDPNPMLVEIADRLPPACSDCASLLRKGIGVHHASTTAFEQRAVEDAARRGLLRYLVCTDTLLAGVDFPIRTVIVVHDSRGPESSLSVGDLRNLAGRAGRGGRFSSGEFIIMTTTRAKAESVLRRLAEYVPPPTASQLKNAIRLIEQYRGQLELPTEESREAKDLDAFLLRAVAEAALRQGDLRLELEKTLGRTLWWASAPQDRRDALLDAAEERAEAFGSPIVPRDWNRIIYRTGLDRGSCNALRERLEQVDRSEIEALADVEQVCAEESAPILAKLALLATEVCPVERTWPETLNAEEGRRQTIQDWLAGVEPESPQDRPQEQAFDYLTSFAPWVVGASIEILGWMFDFDSTQLARIHANLGLDRLRSGAPSISAARLVDQGLPRPQAAELWHRYRASGSPESFLIYAIQELEQRTAELIGLCEPLDQSDPLE